MTIKNEFVITRREVTPEEIQKSLNDLGALALGIKNERDTFMSACLYAYRELDDRYDVDQPGDGSHKEFPFDGAGEVLRKLRYALEKAGVTL